MPTSPHIMGVQERETPPVAPEGCIHTPQEPQRALRYPGVGRLYPPSRPKVIINPVTPGIAPRDNPAARGGRRDSRPRSPTWDGQTIVPDGYLFTVALQVKYHFPLNSSYALPSAGSTSRAPYGSEEWMANGTSPPFPGHRRQPSIELPALTIRTYIHPFTHPFIPHICGSLFHGHSSRRQDSSNAFHLTLLAAKGVLMNLFWSCPYRGYRIRTLGRALSIGSTSRANPSSLASPFGSRNTSSRAMPSRPHLTLGS